MDNFQEKVAFIWSVADLLRGDCKQSERAIIDAFADLERQLASPSGETLTSPPSHPAPRRRPG